MVTFINFNPLGSCNKNIERLPLRKCQSCWLIWNCTF